MINNDNEIMEESFSKLLDEYLDFEEIELKKLEDETYEFSSKTITYESPFQKEDSISIAKFVNEYLGINSDCNNLLHCGLKDLKNEYVIGIDNNFANKNPDYVKKGYLLLVIDCRKKRGTYINPYQIRKYLSKGNVEETLKVFGKLQEIELKKLSAYLNKYEAIKSEMDDIENFYRFLKEVKKVKNVQKIEEHQQQLHKK